MAVGDALVALKAHIARADYRKLLRMLEDIQSYLDSCYPSLERSLIKDDDITCPPPLFLLTPMSIYSTCCGFCPVYSGQLELEALPLLLCAFAKAVTLVIRDGLQKKKKKTAT